MTAYYATYAIFALAVVFLAVVPRELRSPFGLAVLAAGLVLMVATWGRPKPVWLEVRCDVQKAENTVVAGQVREGEGRILVWLEADACPPTLYELPYDAKTAEQMQKALEQAEERGGAPRLLFEPSLDGRAPKFYPPPQVALPPKPEPPKPTILEQQA